MVIHIRYPLWQKIIKEIYWLRVVKVKLKYSALSLSGIPRTGIFLKLSSTIITLSIPWISQNVVNTLHQFPRIEDWQSLMKISSLCSVISVMQEP